MEQVVYYTAMSPALVSALKKEFNTPPEKLVSAIQYALSSGGNLELDYIRDFEMSYNPRTARVVQLAIEEAPEHDADLLAALAESTSLNPRSSVAVLFKRFELTLAPLTLPDNLHPCASCLLLDRARRLHLIKNNTNVRHVIEVRAGELKSGLLKKLEVALNR